MSSTSGTREKAIDVLIVEDDADARTMMATFLASNECIVRAVASADEAFDAALRRAPDVVVTDLHLPGGSAGFTLAEAIREEPSTRHVGLIAVSGQIEPRLDVVRSLDAYLRKPVDLALVLQLVQQLAAISRSSRRAAAVSG